MVAQSELLLNHTAMRPGGSETASVHKGSPPLRSSVLESWLGQNADSQASIFCVSEMGLLGKMSGDSQEAVEVRT